MPDALEFEQKLLELEADLAALRAQDDAPRLQDRIARREAELTRERQRVYASLTAWQRTQLARHPRRPHTRDFCRLLFQDFLELHGDRVYGEDPASAAELFPNLLDGYS